MTEYTTQNTLVLRHLKRGRSITALEALQRFGIFRLAARICDLRSSGIDIKKEMIERDEKRYAKYFLPRRA